MARTLHLESMVAAWQPTLPMSLFTTVMHIQCLVLTVTECVVSTFIFTHIIIKGMFQL